MFKQQLLDKRGSQQPGSVIRSYTNLSGFPSPYIHKPVALLAHKLLTKLYSPSSSVQQAAQGDSCQIWPLASAEASPAQPSPPGKPGLSSSGTRLAAQRSGSPDDQGAWPKPRLPNKAPPVRGLLTNKHKTQHFRRKHFYIYRIPLNPLANLPPAAAGC